ncbi:universal stress protein [Williamsia sp. SKLECPSW1]
MTPPRTVVYVDESDAALHAVRWAADEAVTAGTDLLIVAVYDDGPSLLSWTFPDAAGPDILRALETRLDTAEIVARNSVDPLLRNEFVVDTELFGGSTVEVLLETSRTAEMIVVPTPGFARHDPMSQYARVLTEALCPVVVVDEAVTTPMSPLGAEVVVGVDGLAASSAAIARGFVEADRRGALLHAVHVWDVDHRASMFAQDAEAGADQTAERAVLAESLAGYRTDFPDVPVVMSTVYDDAVECLTRMSMRADLMIVGSRARGRLMTALTGSAGRELSMTAGCPLMIVRPISDRAPGESPTRSWSLPAVLRTWRERRHAVGAGSGENR